jgi:hypothetical protein
LLGMRAEGHEDFYIEAHPQNAFSNEHSPRNESCRPPSPFLQDQVGHAKPKQKQEVTLKVSSRQRSSLRQRPEDGEGARSEVYQMNDVTGWTCVTSLFAGHKNICRSQRNVMTS